MHLSCFRVSTFLVGGILSILTNILAEDSLEGEGRQQLQPSPPESQACIERKEYISHDFWKMSEFVYGQRALYGEKCDPVLYEEHVRPIFKLSAQGDAKWLRLQHEYRILMQKNRHLRTLTCHSHHLMQCSSTPNANGDHVCECLQEGPEYNLVYDAKAEMCAAAGAGYRCFSPFGYNCPSGHFCQQAHQEFLVNGECICVEESVLRGLLNVPADENIAENKDFGNCRGCAKEVIQGHVYPAIYNPFG